MATLDIKMLSGIVPQRFLAGGAVDRVEQKENNVLMYLEEVRGIHNGEYPVGVDDVLQICY